MRALHQLDLSDEQKDALKALRESKKDAVQANREQVRDAKKALREEMQTEQVNLDAVRTLAGDVGAVEVELAVFRASMKNQMMKILTEEQRAELQEMAQKRQERVEQWKTEGGPRSRGRRGGHRQHRF
jgi:protein CpxP